MNPMMQPQKEEPFDFSKYEVSQEAAVQENLAQEPTSNEPFDFKKYEEKPPPTAFEEFQRHGARVGARVAETVAGFPGDFVGFVKFLGSKLPEEPSFLKREPNIVQKAGKTALESLPTSSDLKEATSYLTSGFTDPQGAYEQLGDDVTSLATSLLIPSKEPAKFTNLVKSVGKAVLAKSAGKGTEALGGGHGAQAAAEIGTLFLTGMFGGKTADAFVGDQYAQAKSKIPAGTMINTGGLAHELTAIETELAKGISTATKDEVRGAVQQLKAKAAGGAMEAEELIESYHNINERLNSKKLLDELDSSTKKILRHRYDKVKGAVNKEIDIYGASNPEFYKQWREANQAFKTIVESKKVSSFISGKLGLMPKHLATSLAIELYMGHPFVAAGSVAGYTAVKAGEMMYRIAKSPKLQEHYLNVLREASAENLPAVIKNIEALDKGLKDKE